MPDAGGGSPRNARDFGAAGNGASDDTQSLQAVVDSFSRPGPTGVVEIPAGTYRITRPLVYSGDYSYGLTIRGGGSAAGPSGTVLLYDGPPGQPVIDLRGCTSTTVERLAIHGGDKAGTGIAIRYGAAQKMGTSGVYLDQLCIGGCVDSAVSAGYTEDGVRDNAQCDHIVMSRCTLQGAGKTKYGLLTGWANCKNFAVRDCSFVGFQTGIQFGGSGFMIVDGFAGGGNTVADFGAGTGNLEIRAGNSEYSARLVTGTTGANPGSVSITGFSWASDRVPDDQVVISYQGVLSLAGNHFWNDTSPTAIPRVRLLEVAGAMTSLASSGNFYQRASGSIPVVSWDGGPLRGSPVRSFGDFGGTGGQLVRLSGPIEPPPADLRVAGDLVVGGTIRGAAIDLGGGRRWTPEGLYLSPERHWTDDGLFPGIGVKWPDAGGLIGRAGGNLDWVDWVDRTNSTVVKSGRGRK